MSQCQVCGGEHSEPWEMARAAEQYAARMTTDEGERLSLGIAYLMGIAEFAGHNPAHQPPSGSQGSQGTDAP